MPEFGYVSISMRQRKRVLSDSLARPIDRVPGTPKYVRHFYRGGGIARAIFLGAPRRRRHHREGTKLPIMRLCASFDREGTRDRELLGE